MDYLVWSNEQGAWWRPAQRGYTPLLDEAGRYSRDEAEAIVAKATFAQEMPDGSPHEVMVLAPRSISW